MTRRISSAGKWNEQRGFSYVIVLVAIVVVTISAQVVTPAVSRIIRSDKEQELLFRGQAYLKAIESYYRSVPQNPAYPRHLSDLEKDPRFLLKRHIRQLYSEPFAEEWRLLTNSDGKIVGVASSSLHTPIKSDNFPIEFSAFTATEHYADWEFIYTPSPN